MYIVLYSMPVLVFLHVVRDQIKRRGPFPIFLGGRLLLIHAIYIPYQSTSEMKRISCVEETAEDGFDHFFLTSHRQKFS